MESGPSESSDSALAISSAIFGLCGEDGGFDRVLRIEDPEGGRTSEPFDMDSLHGDDALKVVPPDQVYDVLGGDAVVVEPVLSGRRRLIVTYGRSSDRRRILQELTTRACRELAKRAEQCAHMKLYSLNIACMKCSLCDAEEDVVFDLLGQQIVDAAGITRETISSILKPLGPDAVSNITALLNNRQMPPSDRSGCFILHIEAEHANDIGALTAISVPSADRMTEEIAENHHEWCHGLAEHAASLRRLGELMDAFSQRVGGSGGSGTFSSLLLLMPRRCAARSHYAMVVRECFQLRDDHDRTVQGEDTDDDPCRLPSLGSRCFTERNCVLASPPGSDQLSWDTGGSITPSALSSPDVRQAAPSLIGDDMADGHESSARQGPSGSSLRPDQTGIPGELNQPIGASVSGVPPGNYSVASPADTSCRAGRVHGELVESPRHFLHLLAGEEQMLVFHPEDMLRQMQDEGHSSEQQVQELLQLVLKLQQRHREVVAISRRFIQSFLSTRDSADGSFGAQSVGNSSGSVSTGAGVATADRLRWSQRVPVPATSMWNDGAALGNSSPRLMARTALQNRQPPPADGGRQCVLGSPRWVSSNTGGEPKRSPVRQPSGMLLHERAVDSFAKCDPPPSPLTRSRSATFPSCSVLGLVPPAAGKAMTIHGDVAVSPQVPPRDISTARSRSVMQATVPASLSVVPPLSVQSHLQRGITLQACGSLVPATTIPGLPPPVQVSSGAGTQIDTQSVLPSPRKQQRLCDDGVRSPLPAPPGHALNYPKAIDRTPHSARSNFVVGGLSHAPPAENVRWDHASPCRVRYMGSSGGTNSTSKSTGNAPLGTVSAGPTRQILGPPPKTTQPGACPSQRQNEGPHVSASYSRTVRVSISSKSAK